MFVEWKAGDAALDRENFAEAEVAYNLVHLISESNGADCWKSTDGNLIYAQNGGHNAWLWVTDSLEEGERERLIRDFVCHRQGEPPLAGVTGTPATAKTFAIAYAEQRGCIGWHSHMTMEVYYCPEVAVPQKVPGTMRLASRKDQDTVAEFLAGFSFDAFGVPARASSQMEDAAAAIGGGHLYLWQVQGLPVSMANIAHRTKRHARINGVYTPRNHRKHGYASALVAAVCRLIRDEGLTPMLYADASNPDSNSVYRRIGFVPAGRVADIKFDKETAFV